MLEPPAGKETEKTAAVTVVIEILKSDEGGQEETAEESGKLSTRISDLDREERYLIRKRRQTK